MINIVVTCKVWVGIYNLEVDRQVSLDEVPPSFYLFIFCSCTLLDVLVKYNGIYGSS